MTLAALSEDDQHHEMNSIETAVHRIDRVRNLAIIAHVDHGKTTIADRLLAKASMLRDQDTATRCAMDTGKLEQERGITIKATSTGLLYQREQLLINLVDCPGHVDFNSEVSAALRITDGCLVVVDCVEGVCVQTETVLRQALQEGVRPVLFLNKLDRAITELQLSPEQCYQRLVSTIESVNSICREYTDRELCPTLGNVIFGSGLFGWAFTLSSFAAARGMTGKSRRLWGERWFNPESGKVTKTQPSPQTERTFVSALLQPLYKLHAIAEGGDFDQLAAFVQRNNLSSPPRQDRCKDMVRALLRSWLPCADVIVEVADQELPNPAQSQRERAAVLGAGLENTAAFEGIQAADADGPLVAYITKLAPMGKGSGKKQVALGRVFSGTVRPGDRVTMINQRGQRMECRVERVKMMMVDKMIDLPAAPAGSLIGLVGIEYVGTVVGDSTTPGMQDLTLAVSPVVSVAVRAKKPADTSRVVEKLRVLARADQSLLLEHDRETGEHCLVGAGELHVEAAIHDLQELLPDSVQVIVGEPAVRCRETVKSVGPICLTKSGNKHNRIFARAVPLSAEVEELLESGTLSEQTEEKNRAEMLADRGWDRNEARRKVLRISGNNILVDCTEGLDTQQVAEHLISAFDQVTDAGVLTSSPVAGVRIELHDGTRWHKERTHRGPNQMVDPARRAFLAAMLSAEPALREPILECKVQLPESMAQKACSVLKQRRGLITGYTMDRLVTVEGRIPVDESFGLSGELRKETAGYAFPQCAFCEWRQIPGEALGADNLASAMVNKTRARKGLSASLPKLSDLSDKL